MTAEPGTICPHPAKAPWSRSDSLEFEAHTGAVPTARHRTRAVLSEWGLAELADRTGSVAAELVCNAIEGSQREHLDAPIRLTMLAGAPDRPHNRPRRQRRPACPHHSWKRS